MLFYPGRHEVQAGEGWNMGKTLIVVESPAKAKTIKRFLGDQYEIVASVGHIRDLPASTLGVDVHNDYKPIYITMPGKDSVVRNLQKKGKQADRILIATDPDREGEAIAWHVAKVLKLDPKDDIRISFNEITPKAVSEAVTKPRPINIDLVEAQQARRILDRLVGYELSPLLWKKILKGLSAGRVQSVVTKLIIDRENEIKAFVPEEYWKIQALFGKEGMKAGEKMKVSYRLVKEGKDGPADPAKEEAKASGPLMPAAYQGILDEKGKIKSLVPHSQAECESIVSDLQGVDFSVYEYNSRTRKRSPGPPYTTSTLQQDASRFLSFSSSRCMRVAQQLYEGVSIEGETVALITYIRTDSTRTAPEALDMVRDRIGALYGEEYLPSKKRYFRKKKGAQDAHEAIRPVDMSIPLARLQAQLTRDQFRLYQMIWQRFMASQMAEAQYKSVTVNIQGGQHIFRLRGEQLLFPGFLKAYGGDQQAAKQASQPAQRKKKNDEGEEEEGEMVADLPPLTQGETLYCHNLDAEQKFTNPPPRYNESSIIKTLEELGIGRPSTYAPTISTVLARKYVELQDRKFYPTKLGIIVNDLLEQNFDKILDPQFTAGMENKLDDIESNKENWVEVIDNFYKPFHAEVKSADEKIEKVTFQEEKIGEKCPKCGEGDLVTKAGRFGKFIACNRFPDCDYTRNIEIKAPGKCPLCGSGLLEKTTRKRRSMKFYVCDKKGSDPDCAFISWYLPLEKTCPICHAYLVSKKSRGRTYEACSSPSCPNNKFMKYKTEEAWLALPEEERAELLQAAATEKTPATEKSPATEKTPSTEKAPAAKKATTAKKTTTNKAATKKATTTKKTTTRKATTTKKATTTDKATKKDTAIMTDQVTTEQLGKEVE